MKAIFVLDGKRHELIAGSNNFTAEGLGIVDLAFLRIAPGALIVTDEPQRACEILGIKFPNSQVLLHREGNEYIGCDIV
jgi:hypothetical protein